MSVMKSLFTATLVFILVSLSAPNAIGEKDWHICRVDEAGPGADNYVVLKLTDVSTDSSFSGRWFVARQERSNEMLATALVALSNDMFIRIFADDAPEDIQYRIIYNLYLVRGKEL